MTDEADLFNIAHGRPFHRLLRWAEDYESMTPEDRSAYQRALSYIGKIYKGITEGTDSCMATCRRVLGMPSRNEPRFTDLVEAKRPRALALLAHLFACMKLVEDKVPWFKGSAERQVPRIQSQLPPAWQEMLAWPVAVTRGDIGREPKETQIDDILAL